MGFFRRKKAAIDCKGEVVIEEEVLRKLNCPSSGRNVAIITNECGSCHALQVVMARHAGKQVKCEVRGNQHAVTMSFSKETAELMENLLHAAPQSAA